jgi:UDP-glucose 4-epimerase
MSNILVTGGLGYIGSHTTISLIENGYNPIILDNLSNSKIEVLSKIEKISGKKPIFFKGDIRINKNVGSIIRDYNITDVIHFAALKSVYESIKQPLEYYDNNVNGLINILKNMKSYGVKNMIFSSSCTVYGEPDNYPVSETTPIKLPKTPYGVTKSMCEKILEDTTNINSIALRYFNPIGNHVSGMLYEDPNGIPENLIPYIIGVIEGKYSHLRVFGSDYDTPDGSAIRDYIDVTDLANAHVKALKVVGDKPYDVINVGSGNGVSVLDIINSFKDEGVNVPYHIYPRRDGDIEKIYADISKSKTIMDWSPKKNISDSVKSILKSLQNK